MGSTEQPAPTGRNQTRTRNKDLVKSEKSKIKPPPKNQRPKGRYPRDLTAADCVKADDEHRWYRCQFVDCPRPKSLMKQRRKQAGRPPIYHPDCKQKLYVIRNRKDGTPDGQPTDEDKWTPATPDEKRNHTPNGICGSKRIGREGVCCLAAGWGTAHPGIGRCRFHLGDSPSHQVAAAKEMMIREAPVMGNPITIDPHSAVLQEVHRTAGHVEWLRQVIAAMGMNADDPMSAYTEEATGIAAKGIGKALTQMSEAGMSPSVWMQLYQEERKHLIRAAKMAVDMGCAERTVAIAEQQGQMIAVVLRKVLNNPAIGLNNKQRAALPSIVRQELMAMSLETESTTTQSQK